MSFMDHISRLQCKELIFDETLRYFKGRVLLIVGHGQMRAHKDMCGVRDHRDSHLRADAVFPPRLEMADFSVHRPAAAPPPPPAGDRKRAIEMTTDSFRMRRMLHVLGFS